MSSITLRGINSELYKMFKAIAMLKGITVQKAIEEAMELWIRLNSHVLMETDVDAVIEYLRKNPAEPFVISLKEKPIKRWNSWARRKLGMTQ